MAAEEDRAATVADLRRIAASMPHVVVDGGSAGHEVYQVGRKSFVFFRNPRPDALDPDTGERLADVIVIWVSGEDEKRALLAEPAAPFFSTPHFDGHPSVLLRACRVGELSVAELRELVQGAWLAQASARRGRQWLLDNGFDPEAAGG